MEGVCQKSMLLLEPEVDLPRGQSFPGRPWQRRDHSSPSGSASRETPGHLLGGGVTLLSSLGMTQNNLEAASYA